MNRLFTHLPAPWAAGLGTPSERVSCARFSKPSHPIRTRAPYGGRWSAVEVQDGGVWPYQARPPWSPPRWRRRGRRAKLATQRGQRPASRGDAPSRPGRGQGVTRVSNRGGPLSAGSAYLGADVGQIARHADAVGLPRFICSTSLRISAARCGGWSLQNGLPDSGGSRAAIMGQHVKSVLGLIVSADGDRVGHVVTVRHAVLQDNMPCRQSGRPSRRPTRATRPPGRRGRRPRVYPATVPGLHRGRSRDRRPVVFSAPARCEWHLGNVFISLGISSRRELRRALAQLGQATRRRGDRRSGRTRSA